MPRALAPFVSVLPMRLIESLLMFSIRCPTRTALAAALSLLAVSAACGGTSSKPPSPDVWATVDDHQIKQDDVLKTWRREAAGRPDVDDR